ncbi:MAG: 50S ribosomal protein L24 [Chitinophagales bacterium]|nr:50S ribosomal protein L24 [Chitinophagales bacterium]
MKIKKGDTVKVLSGESRGKTGTVLRVIPRENKVVVEGAKIVAKHTKPSAQHPNGGILEKEAPIHISNVQIVIGGQATRVGRKVVDGGIKRYSKKTQELID